MGYLSYQGVGFGLKIIAGLMGSAAGFTVASCLGKRIALPLLASSYITPAPVSSGFLFFFCDENTCFNKRAKCAEKNVDLSFHVFDFF